VIATCARNGLAHNQIASRAFCPKLLHSTALSSGHIVRAYPIQKVATRTGMLMAERIAIGAGNTMNPLALFTDALSG
jgi:hypothetical protein